MKQSRDYLIYTLFLLMFIVMSALFIVINSKIVNIEARLPHEECVTTSINEKFIIEPRQAIAIDCELKDIKCDVTPSLNNDYCWIIQTDPDLEPYVTNNFYNFGNETITCIGTKTVTNCTMVYPR